MNGLDLQLDGIGSVSAPLQIVLLLTLLSFVPAILITMTAFTRIVIVFHFLRQALGTQEMPSNQILIGLSLFLTMYVMAPVADRVRTEALDPAMAKAKLIKCRATARNLRSLQRILDKMDA